MLNRLISFIKKHKLIFLIVFIIDLFIPDPVPLLDEFILLILNAIAYY